MVAAGENDRLRPKRVYRLRLLIRFAPLLFATLLGAADTLLWEPGRVVSVEQVTSPAKEPEASCRSVPKGATLPAQCRPSNLRAQQFWRVTVETGNKRFVVRPYRAQTLLDTLNPSETAYIDPNLTTASPIEVAVVSSKAIRIRTDRGQGIPALVDSQELLAKPAAGVTKTVAAAPATLWSAITVAQPVFQAKEAATLQLYFSVVNDGDTVVNPNVEASRLFINGAEPRDWNILIGNGTRSLDFNALPPGRTLTFTYQLGSRYFAAPGIYTVRWEGPNFRSPEITFRVMP